MKNGGSKTSWEIKVIDYRIGKTSGVSNHFYYRKSFTSCISNRFYNGICKTSGDVKAIEPLGSFTSSGVNAFSSKEIINFQ